jgi:predicted DNA-binding helix-hairpin-helix protein
MEDLVTPMRWVKALQDEGKAGVASGQTTQFIVGATEETDRELLDTVSGLYQDLGLRRAYFSAFRPVVGTPLEHRSPAPPIREHRLYQADFLLRQYGFGFSDLAFEADGSLTLATDPKMVMARQHPEWFPVEVNQAEYETLLRVPGIGPVSAKRIVEGRRESPLTGIEDLRRVGAAAKRAKDYVLISGRSPAEPSAPDEPTLPLGL